MKYYLLLAIVFIATISISLSEEFFFFGYTHVLIPDNVNNITYNLKLQSVSEFALIDLDQTDTLAPVLSYKYSEGGTVITCIAEEKRNGHIDDKPRQVDQGIESIIFDDDQSYNFQLAHEELKTWPPLYEFELMFKVIDKSLPAMTIFKVCDRAGNCTHDTLGYLLTGIENETIDDSEYSIYPNPTSGMATLNFTQNLTAFYNIILTDIYGRELQGIYSGLIENGEQNISINTSSLPAGVYFVRVTCANIVKVLKLSVK